jgi:hypothetical protein
MRRGGEWELNLKTPIAETAFWRKVREEPEQRPEYAAKMTGLAELAWFKTNERPGPSPSLTTLIENYSTKPELTDNERSRSRLFWKEFTKWTGATDLAGITHDTVTQFEAKLAQQDFAPRSVKHRIGKIRTVVA